MRGWKDGECRQKCKRGRRWWVRVRRCMNICFELILEIGGLGGGLGVYYYCFLFYLWTIQIWKFWTIFIKIGLISMKTSHKTNITINLLSNPLIKKNPKQIFKTIPNQPLRKNNPIIFKLIKRLNNSNQFSRKRKYMCLRWWTRILKISKIN
jgi:hypothetical protein